MLHQVRLATTGWSTSSTPVLTELCLAVMSYYVSLMYCDSIHTEIFNWQELQAVNCRLSVVSTSICISLSSVQQSITIVYIISWIWFHTCNRQLERTILKNDQDGVLILSTSKYKSTIFRNAGQGLLFYGTSRTRQRVAMSSSCNATSHWPFRTRSFIPQPNFRYLRSRSQHKSSHTITSHSKNKQTN